MVLANNNNEPVSSRRRRSMLELARKPSAAAAADDDDIGNRNNFGSGWLVAEQSGNPASQLNKSDVEPLYEPAVAAGAPASPTSAGPWSTRKCSLGGMLRRPDCRQSSR